MQQLTQELKSGKMEIMEVPYPTLNPGYVLVRNHYSVISAGTESKTVSDARKGYLSKAKSRKKEVRQVIDMIKTKGFSDTYRVVMNKLEAPSALGYSSAGEVIAVGEKVTGIKVGDFVACGGMSASHADVVSIPINLCAKIPEGVSIKHAAFTTIAAIAMQGIRRSELTLGCNCMIIGLGLIGQLTSQILNASGVKVIGVDISEKKVESAKESGLMYSYNRNNPALEEIIKIHSNGFGVDAVIITAGTNSLDPVELAGIACRKKGKVVIVGAVPTGFSRANYYRKELDLRMSSSYGPGRYELNYEEKGLDYPIGYVRWTEKRNMESYLFFLEQNKLEIDKLISHEFELIDAPNAYQMILERSEEFNGIVIKYDYKQKIKSRIELNNRAKLNNEIKVGFIGAGSFAQNFLLPNMVEKCEFVGILNGHGNSSKYVGNKYSFSYCTSNSDDIFNDTQINTIFIATRHNSHYSYVIEGLRKGKNIFVEKPLVLNKTELEDIKNIYSQNKSNILMVGYNRRYAPAVIDLMKMVPHDVPKSINIRVNSGIMPLDHWVNDREIGGGRILGEGCHFVDLALFIADSPIISVFAQALNDPNYLNNTVNINLQFANGSIANIGYYSNGNKNFPKEQIEVYSGGVIAAINDFKELSIWSNGTRKIKYKGQDKGHKNEINSYFDAIKNGLLSPIPFDQLENGMLATLSVDDSIITGNRIELNLISSEQIS